MTTDMMQKYWESPQNKWNAPNWGNNSISLKFIFSRVHHHTRSPCWCSRPCKNDIRYDRTNVLSERCHVKIQLKWGFAARHRTILLISGRRYNWKEALSWQFQNRCWHRQKIWESKKKSKEGHCKHTTMYFAGHYELLWKWMKTIYHIYIYRCSHGESNTWRENKCCCAC